MSCHLNTDVDPLNGRTNTKIVAIPGRDRSNFSISTWLSVINRIHVHITNLANESTRTGDKYRPSSVDFFHWRQHYDENKKAAKWELSLIWLQENSMLTGNANYLAMYTMQQLTCYQYGVQVELEWDSLIPVWKNCVLYLFSYYIRWSSDHKENAIFWWETGPCNSPRISTASRNMRKVIELVINDRTLWTWKEPMSNFCFLFYSFLPIQLKNENVR